MLNRILFFAYGIVSYLIFLGTFLYAVGFIGSFGVPRSACEFDVDRRPSGA